MRLTIAAIKQEIKVKTALYLYANSHRVVPLYFDAISCKIHIVLCFMFLHSLKFYCEMRFLTVYSFVVDLEYLNDAGSFNRIYIINARPHKCNKAYSYQELDDDFVDFSFQNLHMKSFLIIYVFRIPDNLLLEI